MNKKELNIKKLNKKLRKDLEEAGLLEDLFGLTFGIGDCFYPVNLDKLFDNLRGYWWLREKSVS